MGIVFAQSVNQAIETMPRMHLGHSYQMNLIRSIYPLVQGNRIQIHTIADIDGTLAEYLLRL